MLPNIKQIMLTDMNVKLYATELRGSGGNSSYFCS